MLPAIVTTLAKVVPVVAPVVKDVASGVLQGLANRSQRDLSGIVDQFSRISGNFLNHAVNPRGLPGGAPTILPGGCIPPPDGKWPVPFPPDPNALFERLMTRLDRLMEGLERLLGLLQRLLPQAEGPGPTPSTAPKGGESKVPDGPVAGGLYSEMLRTQAPSTSGPASGGPRPPESPTPSTAPAPKTSAPSSSVPPEGLGGRALERLFDDMHGVESQINGLDPNDPKAQFRLMQLQQKMQRITQMIHLIAEMRKALHDTAMAIIRNIR